MCVRSTPCTRTWERNGFSEELDVVVGVHQGSRFLLIIVLEALEGVSYRLSMGAAVCRILDDQCRVH